MAVLIVAVVLVGVLCLLNLFLSLGVIRRLREHTAALEELSAGGRRPGIIMDAGGTVGPFSAVATSGATVSGDLLGGRALVGFFSPSCEPCKEQVPLFVAYAREFDGTVLAVAAGAATEVGDLVATLDGVGHVVVEADNGPVQRAFGTRGFPAMCVVDAGRVTAGGYQLDALVAPTAA
ncbi:TlpA disulfide reductase family protein [Longispora sp. K20-0274]|uniref:TlpA disulfide reductase family protein n=1 Tax=Longispora sp. K20-0274 TaxID=3088255 RepID=UPI003999AE39